MHDDNRGDDRDPERGQDSHDQQRTVQRLVGLSNSLLRSGRCLVGDQLLADPFRNRPLNQRKVGDGSQRSGSHSTKADQPAPRSTPPTTSLGQWSPAQTLAMQVSTITITAPTQSAG